MKIYALTEDLQQKFAQSISSRACCQEPMEALFSHAGKHKLLPSVLWAGKAWPSVTKIWMAKRAIDSIFNISSLHFLLEKSDEWALREDAKLVMVNLPKEP